MISYAGLFVFTFILYFRPYELFSALSQFRTIAFWSAIVTFVIYVPSQFMLEGNLSIRIREVTLLLLLVCAIVLSIPLAANKKDSLDMLQEFMKAALIFIVTINVVRTERRLKSLMLLGIGIGVVLSLNIINDFRLGNIAADTKRVVGIVGGMFGNPNDLALHLVMMIPLAIALLFTTRNVLSKLVYAGCSLVMVSGCIVTFSRGGFLGLSSAIGVLGWKIGKKNRMAFALVMLLGIGIVLLAPGGYGSRLGTIVDNKGDTTGSAEDRKALLLRSLKVTARHPLVGVGINNFHTYSIHELVTHNAYTQVSAEIGIPAMLIYVAFMVAPFRRLRRVEENTFEDRKSSHFYYLAIGLQASLVAYMVSSFFAAVAYQWYIYYLVAYAIAFRRIYESETGVATEKGQSATWSKRVKNRIILEPVSLATKLN